MATEILKKQTIVGTDAQYEANRNSYEEGTVFESTSLLGESDIDPTYTNKFVERKVSTTGLYAYCFDQTGITKTRYISEGFPAYSLVERDENGRVRTADPVGQNDAVTKGYTEANFVSKIKDNTTGNYILYSEFGGGNEFTLKVNPADGMNQFNGPEFIPKYGQSCQLYALTDGGEFPTSDEKACLTNRQYVDDNFVPTQKTTNGVYLYAFDSTGNIRQSADTGPHAYTVARRTANGTLQVGDPVGQNDAVNKSYADNRFRYTHLIEIKFNPAPEPYVSYVVIGTITYTSNSSTPLTSIDQLPVDVALPIHGKYQEDPTHFYETYTATRKTTSTGSSYLDITYLHYSDSEGIAADSVGEFVPTSFTDTVV